ncbi:MerR family transcriptional regulator [Maricaulis sp.]|uniref:MerR family transcriptional regulator n=1 Tax=Maricaulis sp. TaxID=1486257 RepID=UPI001B0EDD32|nr:MerR family transcriptional regulator [Maricaulis sp.]MBO6764987.1 MerR family transcriptional regulator [Maricaulis sp.]
MSVSKKSPEAFRTISEAAEELDVPAHVLRFWESKFPQISPLKRAGGRRFYRPQDLQLLRGIKRLLYEDGFTIKGARKFLKDNGVASVMDLGAGVVETGPMAVDAADIETPVHKAPAAPRPADGPQRQLDDIIADLENARARLKSAIEP